MTSSRMKSIRELGVLSVVASGSGFIAGRCFLWMTQAGRPEIATDQWFPPSRRQRAFSNLLIFHNEMNGAARQD